ncbi:LOW QUALITY PROTEIN: hypothetical protein RJ640_012826 [Escallonia rubra]|uniref:Uncharacterized protein n=1 Tax=Escallonia rubra TaxID=112253 RepID=A0AA88RRR1_9ASTE|nr:LOW QUALITY PROTEIN: hypothetical protein RJ640_012826 [Escallonia rubra]
MQPMSFWKLYGKWLDRDLKKMALKRESPKACISSATYETTCGSGEIQIMDTMSSDQTYWSFSYPNLGKSGSSWVRIECKSGIDNHLHACLWDTTKPGLEEHINIPLHKYLAFLTFGLRSFSTASFIPKLSLLCFHKTVFFNSPLQQLSLRSNSARVGSIPPQISSLKSFQILTLSQNCLSGILPSELFILGSLVHLDLSYNSLTGNIPKQLGSLRNLEALDLSYNSLTCHVPYTISQLGLYQKLDLRSNSLVGSIPNIIEKLNSLVFLALSNNRLRGKFPKGIVKL